MELRHLRYFIVLAEELHFGHAARRLHITQPPLSTSIRQLEDHLGARLFARDSRSVHLTPVGEAFLPEAMRAVAQAQAAEDAGRALATGKVGRLQIGFTSSMLYRGMPELLRLGGDERLPLWRLAADALQDACAAIGAVGLQAQAQRLEAACRGPAPTAALAGDAEALHTAVNALAAVLADLLARTRH